MKFFIDSADIEEIKSAHERGWVDGVTTNPSLIAQSGRSRKEVIKDICKIISGPISVEVLNEDAKGMVHEAEEILKLYNVENIVIKIPMCEEGLVAVKKLTKMNIKTNVTLIFSALQALLAAKAGATYCSPFVGRLDDVGSGGMDLISQIEQIYSNYDMDTQILVASIRNPIHILEAALIGADVVTAPLKVMKLLVNHPLTDKGIEQFLADAKRKS